MAKIVVQNYVKKTILIDGTYKNVRDKIPSIKDQLNKVAYFKIYKSPNDSVPPSSLNSECTGGTNNSLPISWQEIDNGISLVAPLSFPVSANEVGRSLLLGLESSNGGIDGRVLFDVDASKKPASWLQYVRNITITIKGDGEV